MTIYNQLIKSSKSDDKYKIALIDPDKKNQETLKDQIDYAHSNDYCAIFVGGSLMMDSKFKDRIELIKDCSDLPVIAFPSSGFQLNKYFDAILFLILISGRNPHYLIGEHVVSSPVIYDLDIETISIGYILLNGGGNTTVEVISNTRSIPMESVDVVVAHSLASQYMGHNMIYLECGSNAERHISLDLLKTIRRYISIPLIVGGGIKNDEDIVKIKAAGADFVVTGSLIEKKFDK